MATRPNSADALLAYSVLDCAPGPVLVLDADWIVRYLNQSCIAILARGELDALLGRRLFDIVPELPGTPFQSHIERAIAGVAVDFQSYHTPSDRWIAIAAHPVPDGVAIFASDVTADRRREAELESARARLDAIINSTPDLVMAVDRNLTFLAFNRAYGDVFERTFGRKIRVGETFRDALADHPEAMAEAIARWERAAVHGEEFTTHRELGADGKEPRIYQVRYGNLRSESGELLGAVSTMNDVTESMRDRSALTELTERLDAVIRYSPDRVVGVDLALRVVAMNEHARHDFSGLWGVAIEVGDSLYEKLRTLPDEQRDAAIAMWERAVTGKAITQFAVFGTTPETMQAYEISFGALRNSEGEPAGAVMVAKDVTDREVALNALRESEARFRALGEAAPIGIFLADAQGHCTYANPSLQRIWELREATLLTTGFASRVHRGDIESADAWLGLSGRGLDFRGEFRLVMDDGVERWVLAHSAAIRDETGTIVGRVGTIDDITDARLADDARLQLEQKMLRAQKLESLEVLAGGIAHDFNNLLVGVLGNASLALLDLPDDSPAHAPVVDIERAAQRASDLTRQMLAYSGRGQFVVEPVDVSELVAEMGSLLRTVLSRQAILDFTLDGALPRIEADATQIRQVVMNLITNASDAVGENGGHIRVRTGRQRLAADASELSYLGDPMPPGDYVFVEVEDTGDGMTEDTLTRIFEPFFTTKFTGRGLGLAATLGIVRGHRGGIRIRSAPGLGSTFRVLLPITDVPDAQTPSSAMPVRGDTLGAVLVIDDDETVRAVARRLLERRGFRVVVASNGVDGVEKFREAAHGFSLVLLDLTMPKMGGAAAMAELRKLDPDVRVLVTSGYREREVTAHFVGMEPAGFVQKPFRAEELYAAVTRTMRLS
ncbi:MAG: PAS domain-containing protein [Gemmatimonadaceae bacterium]|nr:PAS domain-containing protein [Gemmatimonadaceae bacterium]